MDTQDRLLSMIADENIIEAICIPTEFSIAEILDERDTEEFSQRWMAAFNLLESQKDRMSKNQTDFSRQMCETAYLRAFARWKSPDLAAYVSDDFGLISDAAALAIDDPWVNGMLQSYRKGAIPCAAEEN